MEQFSQWLESHSGGVEWVRHFSVNGTDYDFVASTPPAGPMSGVEWNLEFTQGPERSTAVMNNMGLAAFRVFGHFKDLAIQFAREVKPPVFFFAGSALSPEMINIYDRRSAPQISAGLPEYDVRKEVRKKYTMWTFTRKTL